MVEGIRKGLTKEGAFDRGLKGLKGSICTLQVEKVTVWLQKIVMVKHFSHTGFFPGHWQGCGQVESDV